MLASPDNGVPVLQTEQARRRRLWMPLFIAVVIEGLVLALTAGGREGPVVGSGSTLAEPLMTAGAIDFRNASSADNPQRPTRTGSDWVLDGSGIDYEPVGSLGGIMRLRDRAVDFAVSDYPLSANALNDFGFAQFPVALGSIAVVHSLPIDDEIRLDTATLAEIYQGRITHWNAPAIVRLNPDVTLPTLAITPVHRSDGSGSTYGFTRYLSSGSPAWQSGPGTASSVTWPTGVGTAAQRSSGMVESVRDTPGALGYVETGQAERAGLKVASLRNVSRSFAAPARNTMQAAVTGMDWAATSDFSQPPASSGHEHAYPMTVAVYVIVPRQESGPRDRRGATRDALRFSNHLIDQMDDVAEDLGYLPLPPTGVDAVKAHWKNTFGFDAG